ncbi:LLM class flavin-dependent oxidoreductase [Actinoplanes sp. TBRC 11911]|uniref:LLM class flavin-dependent oxidoreductase n=1 Tax=Actinoplanes sp. TBRC 11911 TaxID=2729386 RepID=UPI00145EF494|nr:LLM class flavin-dependent oxidoreductase [Actinoplanes sp. TBRC 11911]NMO51654.1 LLM class flavin-dependent oxidoreductase [Actinoplanes sp. TBRC 11911]
MNTPAFRFGISLLTPRSAADWAARAHEAEDQGYHVIQSADQLGMAGPFLGLLAAAEATHLRVGTYVLNAGVHSAAYLARDAADLYRLTDGRFEMGVGAGMAASAGSSSPGSRIRNLNQLLTETLELLAAEADQPKPPVMVAGAGKRALELAARTADIVSFPITAGLGEHGGEQELDYRVKLVRQAARGREVELNLFVQGMGARVADIDLGDLPAQTGRSAQELADLPGVLVGSPREIADTLRHYREELGISYISVREPYQRAFAEVIEQLR